MDNKIISTTNGYKVSIRPFISYPKYIEIQKTFTANTMIDPNSKEITMPPVSANITYEVQEKLIRYLIIKIEDQIGQLIDNKDDYLPLPPIDCNEVMEEINKISNEAAEAFSKKKRDDIILKTFKAFFNNTPMNDQDIQLIYICDSLHITYTELLKQPASSDSHYLSYLTGKNKAEEALQKKKK